MRVCFDQFNTTRPTTIPVRCYNKRPVTNAKHCSFHPKCNLLNGPLFLSNVNRFVRPCYPTFANESRDFPTTVAPLVSRLQRKRSSAIIQQHLSNLAFEDSAPLRSTDAASSQSNHTDRKKSTINTAISSGSCSSRHDPEQKDASIRFSSSRNSSSSPIMINIESNQQQPMTTSFQTSQQSSLNSIKQAVSTMVRSNRSHDNESILHRSGIVSSMDLKTSRLKSSSITSARLSSISQSNLSTEADSEFQRSQEIKSENNWLTRILNKFPRKDSLVSNVEHRSVGYVNADSPAIMEAITVFKRYLVKEALQKCIDDNEDAKDSRFKHWLKSPSRCCRSYRLRRRLTSAAEKSLNVAVQRSNKRKALDSTG